MTRYKWKYQQDSDRLWRGSVYKDKVVFIDGFFTAVSERRLRNKLARFIRKARRVDALHQQTHRTSS